jgi:hypothetical protein
MAQMLPCPCLRAAPEAPQSISSTIDGPHAYARKRGFTQRRDEHLRLAHGMRVRWDLMSREQQKKGDDEIMQDFRDLIKGL